MQRSRVGSIFIAALALAGCDRPAPSPASAPIAPAVRATSEATAPPEPASWAGIEPLVREQIEDRLAELREAPADADRWVRLALAYHANDLIDLAEPAYARAVALDGRDPRWWYWFAKLRAELGDVHGAVEAADAAVARADDPPAFLLWRRGFWRLEQGRLAEAEEDFRHAMARDGGDPVAVMGLARTLLQRDRPEDAAALLEPLLRSGRGMPNGSYAAQLLGTALQRLGRMQDALPLLAQDARRSLSWPDPWTDELFDHRRLAEWMIVIAHRLVQQGHPVEAIEYLAPLAQVKPDDPVLRKQLAMAHFAAGDGETAIALLAQVIQQDPEDFSARLNHAFALEQLGLLAEAQSATEQIIRLRPGHRETQEQLGRILLALGDTDAAFEHYQRLSGTFSRSVETQIGLARSALAIGQLSIAAQAAAEARVLSPDDPRIAEIERALREAAR